MKKCNYCTEETAINETICKHCGKLIINTEKKDSILPIIIEQIDVKTNTDKEIKGLSGWLIIVIIGLIITPFSLISGIESLFISELNSGSLAQLITVGSGAYIEWYFPIWTVEFLWNIILIILSTVLIYLFFSKYKYFPALYIVFLFSNFLFLGLDYLLSDFMYKTNGLENDYEALILAGRSFITFAIWGSYMHVSKRVKNTFIENNYKNKNPGSYILIALIIVIFIGTFVKIDFSKLSYSEFQYGTDICFNGYGENSHYSGEQDDESYLCDCKEGYDFGGENDDKCILINN